VGWADGPYEGLDHRCVLVGCLFCRVRPSLHPPTPRNSLTKRKNSIYYLYTLIRRPRLILDFALTLIFNHLVLTTYYSASLPTSFFFWLVLLGGSAVTVVVAEQLCVKREMREGLSVVNVRPDPEDVEVDEMEMGGLLRRD